MYVCARGVCVCMPVWFYVCHVHAVPTQVKRKCQLAGTGVQVAVRCQAWALGTELGASASTVSVRTYGVTCPAPGQFMCRLLRS